MERNHNATTGDPRVAKRNDFPPANEVQMSGKLPGAKQQFRIPIRPSTHAESLEQLSFSDAFLCRSLSPVSGLSWLPPPPFSSPPPPFTPSPVSF
jgi:hypothetical protein